MAVKPFDVAVFSRANFIDPKEVGYKDSIDIIYDELQKTRKSFIKIGWYLKHINEAAMYKEDGYANIYEFAHDKFNISQPTATRFINLCKEFSVGNDSPELDERYMDFSVSQLFEMLPMKEDEKEQVTPDMTVKEIREIKKDKEPDNAVIMAFYYGMNLGKVSNGERKDLKGYMLAHYGKTHAGGGPDPNFQCTPRGIKLENFDEITWTNFVKRVSELFPTPEEDPEGETVQEVSAKPERDDDIPGQTSIEKDFPEYLPSVDKQAALIKQEKEIVIDGEYREVEEKASGETARLCITGFSRYGTCYCCGHDGIQCCAQCKEDCNGRCGWINDPYVPPQKPENEPDRVSSSEQISLCKEIEKLIDSVSGVFCVYEAAGWEGTEWKWREIPVEKLEASKKDALLLANAIEKLMGIILSGST